MAFDSRGSRGGLGFRGGDRGGRGYVLQNFLDSTLIA
jgi:hypothetical protein